MTEDVTRWADALDAALREAQRELGRGCVSRVRVYAEVGSTQDAARAAAGDVRDLETGGAGGLLVTCGRQTAGRGRLGRVWQDGSHASDSIAPDAARTPGSLSVTFAVATPLDDRALSMAAGLAAFDAAAALLGLERCLAMPTEPGAWRLALKEPNDLVVVRDGLSSLHAETGVPRRKLAGVLIERAAAMGQGTALIGIGMNVTQIGPGDFPRELTGQAVSLRMLTGPHAASATPGITRIAAAWALVRTLTVWLGRSEVEIEPAWRARLVNTGDGPAPTPR